MCVGDREKKGKSHRDHTELLRVARADGALLTAHKARAPMSFSSQAQVDAVLKDLKGLLTKNGNSVMEAFHAVDKDNSNQLSATEFATALKSINISLPGHVLRALISRFDANGDGTVSIPEFSSFLTGDVGRMDALRSAVSHRCAHLHRP